MRHAARHEPIGRAIGGSPIAVMTMADVVLRANPDYPQIKTFHCCTLRCDITKEACAANYTRTNAPISCKGCPIGSAHANGLNYRNETNRHVQADATRALACIRCEKSAHTNKRLIGRMRLVRSATLCVSCVNRHLEYEKRANSKGAVPRLILFPAIITIQTAEGEKETLDIGLRLNYHECARYVERVHPGATLIETAIGGEIILQFSLWTPLPFSPWEPDIVRDEKPSKPKRTYTRRSTPRISKKTSAVASPVDWDDWDTPLYAKPAPSDESDSDGSRQARRCGWLPPMSEEDDAAYRASFEEHALDPESIAAFWDGMNADGLPEFIEWLTEDWPTFKHAPGWEPSAADKAILNRGLSDHLVDCAVYGYPKRQQEAPEPPAPVADGIALPEVSEPVSEAQDKPTEATKPTVEPEAVSEPARDPIAKAISKLETIKNPSRKVRRELGRLYEKQERRAERQAAAPAERTQFPSIRQTAKAFVAVLMHGQGKFAK